MRFWDNDFDRMFDEAIEELEREENPQWLRTMKTY